MPSLLEELVTMYSEVEPTTVKGKTGVCEYDNVPPQVAGASPAGDIPAGDPSGGEQAPGMGGGMGAGEPGMAQGDAMSPEQFQQQFAALLELGPENPEFEPRLTQLLQQNPTLAKQLLAELAQMHPGMKQEIAQQAGAAGGAAGAGELGQPAPPAMPRPGEQNALGLKTALGTAAGGILGAGAGALAGGGDLGATAQKMAGSQLGGAMAGGLTGSAVGALAGNAGAFDTPDDERHNYQDVGPLTYSGYENGRLVIDPRISINPGTVVGALGGGYVGGEAGNSLADALGGGEDARLLARRTGNVVGGVGGAIGGGAAVDAIGRKALGYDNGPLESGAPAGYDQWMQNFEFAMKNGPGGGGQGELGQPAPPAMPSPGEQNMGGMKTLLGGAGGALIGAGAGQLAGFDPTKSAMVGGGLGALAGGSGMLDSDTSGDAPPHMGGPPHPGSDSPITRDMINDRIREDWLDRRG